MRIPLETLWGAIDPQIRAEVAAGKHQNLAGLQRLYRYVMAISAEGQIRGELCEQELYGDLARVDDDGRLQHKQILFN
jgi:hypothetical protein